MAGHYAESTCTGLGKCARRTWKRRSCSPSRGARKGHAGQARAHPCFARVVRFRCRALVRIPLVRNRCRKAYSRLFAHRYRSGHTIREVESGTNRGSRTSLRRLDVWQAAAQGSERTSQCSEERPVASHPEHEGQRQDLASEESIHKLDKRGVYRIEPLAAAGMASSILVRKQGSG